MFPAGDTIFAHIHKSYILQVKTRDSRFQFISYHKIPILQLIYVCLHFTFYIYHIPLLLHITTICKKIKKKSVHRLIFLAADAEMYP